MNAKKTKQDDGSTAVAEPAVTTASEVAKKQAVTVPAVITQAVQYAILAEPRAGDDPRYKDRMEQIALFSYRTNSKIAQCVPRSIAAAIMEAALHGVEVGILGESYIIPRRNNQRGGQLEANFQLGYRGLMSLARRSGEIAKIEACVVRDGDTVFDYERGTTPYIKHKPARENRGKITAAYAVAWLTNGQNQFEVMEKDDLDKIKAVSAKASGGTLSNVWTQWEEEMSKKSAIIRLCKLVALSVKDQRAVKLVEMAEADVPQELDRIHPQLEQVEGGAPDTAVQTEEFWGDEGEHAGA